jgi:hypothetical protein
VVILPNLANVAVLPMTGAPVRRDREWQSHSTRGPPMNRRLLPVRTVGLLTTVARMTRWGLPWLSVLAISAGVASSITMAIAGGVFSVDTPTTSVVVPARADALVSGVPGWSVIAVGPIDCASKSESCDSVGGRLLYVGPGGRDSGRAGRVRCRECAVRPVAVCAQDAVRPAAR